MLFFLFIAFHVELDGAVVLGVLILLTGGVQRVRTLVVRTPTLTSFSFSYFLTSSPIGEAIIIGTEAY